MTNSAGKAKQCREIDGRRKVSTEFETKSQPSKSGEFE